MAIYQQLTKVVLWGTRPEALPRTSTSA